MPSLGTNTGAVSLPFQNWRPFKEAFAPELIERAVKETQGCLGRSLSCLVDPFGGSGTSALAAQFLGIRPTTIEVNPFLSDLIEAKVATYDLGKASRLVREVVDSARQATPSDRLFPGAPQTFVEPGVDGRFIFSLPVAQRIVAYRDAIDLIEDPAFRRLFRVILGSVAIPVSNVVVSGKGRRYRKKGTFGRGVPELVDRLFLNGVTAALFDIRRYEKRPCRDYVLLRGDARRLIPAIGGSELAVFSPPYPNSFDYTDVYNVELWVLGYLSNSASNRSLRESTLRSHVQIRRDMSSGISRSVTLHDVVEKLSLRRDKLWNRHIPEMIEAYIHDMREILGSLEAQLCPGGRVYMAVGDSRYSGIDIPTARMLTEEAPHLGFAVENIEAFRSMRSSPQQGGSAELPETLIVLSVQK